MIAVTAARSSRLDMISLNRRTRQEEVKVIA